MEKIEISYTNEWNKVDITSPEFTQAFNDRLNEIFAVE